MNKLFKTVTNSLQLNEALEKVVPFKKIEDNQHQIMIEGLTLDMSIGILEQEKLKKQRVLLDVVLNMSPKETYEDEIENTISYAEIIEKIQALASSKHFNLVETFAEDIVELCFGYSSIFQADICVKKPDILKHATAVGFRLTQKRA